MDGFEKCKSCKSYLEHYIIIGTCFRPIGGHCINKDLYNPRSRKNYQLIENCEHWQENTEVIEKRKMLLKDAIYCMEKQLSHIEQLLMLLDENKNAPE